MARYDYERLSPESAALLQAESSRSFGHAAATLVFDPGPLGCPDGGVDFDAIRSAIESVLHLVPNLRRKLRWIPFESHPIWVDDREFNLDYHVRHTSLARPGGMEQLRQLAARLQAQRLDRSRPLWECWVVEGLAGGRFALLSKTHGAALERGDADLLQVLLSTDLEARHGSAPPFRARPMPSAAELVRDELLRQARLPRLALDRLRTSLAQSDDLGEELRQRAKGFARWLGYSIRSGPDTPLNGEIGPHRRFDAFVLPLDDAKRIRRRLGGTVHDVILTVLAGAVARYMRAHYVNPATLDFRATIPMSLQDRDPSHAIGEWIVELPIWESDPLRCFEGVCERTASQHRASPALGARAIYGAPGWTSSGLLTRSTRAMAPRAPVSLRIVNVPGSQVPLYLEGARLSECYGKVPLGTHGGLGIAIMSYDGKLCWGLNADFDLVPDLTRFSAAIRDAFEALSRAAARHTSPLAVVKAS